MKKEKELYFDVLHPIDKRRSYLPCGAMKAKNRVKAQANAKKSHKRRKHGAN